MRARHDAKRSISIVTVIKVDTHRQDVLKDWHRRLDEQIAFLFRPARAFGAIDSLSNRDTEILVQRHEPILVN
jgi:hypothetical protein